MNWEEYFNKNHHTELSEIMEKPCIEDTLILDNLSNEVLVYAYIMFDESLFEFIKKDYSCGKYMLYNYLEEKLETLVLVNGGSRYLLKRFKNLDYQVLAAMLMGV